MKILVGTYRDVNGDWIRERRLYNLPIADGQSSDFYRDFTHVVLFHKSKDTICAKIAYVGESVIDDLIKTGYHPKARQVPRKYAVYTLTEDCDSDAILSTEKADVFACFSHYVGKMDEEFFGHPFPPVPGETIHNTFKRLEPYFKVWKSGWSFDPSKVFQMELFSSLTQKVPFPIPREGKFTFIDLFAGIGGFHLAMDQLGGKCVFACEWDKDAAATYEKNFGIRPAGDITKIDAKDIPPHDVLCAGFPCQPFSKAGQQKGFEDETKGTLFFDVERILQYHHPRYFILENVRNLVSHDNGNTWKTIYLHLKKIGYCLTPEPIIVSPHQFGIPQLRERVVIMGIYDPEHSENKLHIELPPAKTKEECSLDSILEPSVNDSSYSLSPSEIQEINVWDEFYKGIKETVIGFPIWVDWFKNLPQAGMPEWKRNFIERNNRLYANNRDFIDRWLKKYNNLSDFTPTMRKMEWQCGSSIKSAWDGFLQKRPSGLRIKRPDCAPALVAIVQIPIIGKYRRRMTVREAARLQSFDDRFLPCENRHQAYKQFGNAVNVTVIKQCAERLLNHE